MHKVRAQDGDVLLKPGQDRLADTERLDRGFVGAGEKVFVEPSGEPENIAQTLRKCEIHGYDPFSENASTLLSGNEIWGCDAGVQQT